MGAACVCEDDATAAAEITEKTKDNLLSSEQDEELSHLPPFGEELAHPEEQEGEATLTPVVAGKRKASTSPETKVDDTEISTRRPQKARAVECEISKSKLTQAEPDAMSDDIISISSEEESLDDRLSTITTNERNDSGIHRKKKTKSADIRIEETSDEDYTSNQSGKSTETKTTRKTNRTKDKDKTFKNPIATSRGRKRKLPEVASREKAKLERDYSREDWLKLSSAELGAVGFTDIYIIH